MADSWQATVPERSAYLPPHVRSQSSNNWRVKDEAPKSEQSPRPRQDRPKTNDESVVDTGCRLYVGNLLYTASREDVEGLFTANGFALTGLSMSIDPFTNRNPSYAFVDFESPEEANRAMDVINGQELLGREVKVNPGVRRQQGNGERRVRDFAHDRYRVDEPRKSTVTQQTAFAK